MDLQLQAGFTESESRFGFVIRMHFFTESETRFSVNPNPDSIIKYSLVYYCVSWRYCSHGRTSSYTTHSKEQSELIQPHLRMSTPFSLTSPHKFRGHTLQKAIFSGSSKQCSEKKKGSNGQGHTGPNICKSGDENLENKQKWDTYPALLLAVNQTNYMQLNSARIKPILSNGNFKHIAKLKNVSTTDDRTCRR